MDTSLDVALAWNFAVALLIATLIGIDREKHKASENDLGIGGLRTFILLGLAGAVSSWLSQQLQSPWILALTVLVTSGMVVAGYAVQARAGARTLGMTTEVAALVTVLLGAACLAGRAELAVALGIVTSAVLAFKQPLHSIVGRIGVEDLYAALKLLVATFIVLPLLPQRALDPWGALNPYQLWWLVILISALSLVGYIAVRALGPRRGTVLTGLFGGLVSSTAVTLTFARQSREGQESPALGRALASGLLLAWAAMFARVMVEVAAVHRPLLPQLAVPFVAMGAATLAAALVLYRLSRAGAPAEAHGRADVPLSNPFRLTSAMSFAAFFAVVLLVVKFAELYLPGRSMYAVAALAGLSDVDAITLSMAALARDGGDAATAVTAIVIAALTNTLVKCGMAVALGGGALRNATIVATGLILLAGGVALLF